MLKCPACARHCCCAVCLEVHRSGLNPLTKVPLRGRKRACKGPAATETRLLAAMQSYMQQLQPHERGQAQLQRSWALVGQGSGALEWQGRGEGGRQSPAVAGVPEPHPRREASRFQPRMSLACPAPRPLRETWPRPATCAQTRGHWWQQSSRRQRRQPRRWAWTCQQGRTVRHRPPPPLLLTLPRDRRIRHQRPAHQQRPCSSCHAAGPRSRPRRSESTPPSPAGSRATASRTLRTAPGGAWSQRRCISTLCAATCSAVLSASRAT